MLLLVTGQWQATPRCLWRSFSVLLDDEKTKLVTQHLYLPSLMCAVTRSQHLHFQLERRKKKPTSEECYYQRYLKGSRSRAGGSGGGEASLSWQGMISREKQRFSFYNISHFGSVNQARLDWHYLITKGLCLAAFFGLVFVTLMYFYSSLLSLPLHLPKNLTPNPWSNHLIQCIAVW